MITIGVVAHDKLYFIVSNCTIDQDCYKIVALVVNKKTVASELVPLSFFRFIYGRF